jgi:hypothetical protein
MPAPKSRAGGWIPACAIALLASGAPGVAQGTPVFDTVIQHGRVIDGTGTPWFQADVGIRAGRIAAIGSLPHMSHDGQLMRADSSWRPVSLTCLASQS